MLVSSPSSFSKTNLFRLELTVVPSPFDCYSQQSFSRSDKIWRLMATASVQYRRGVNVAKRGEGWGGNNTKIKKRERGPAKRRAERKKEMRGIRIRLENVCPRCHT